MLRSRVALLALVGLVALAPRPVLAQPAGAAALAPRRVTLTLEASVRAALTRSPEVRQAEADVEGVRGKELEARGIGYPQVDLTMLLGPSPRARGDQVSSPDDQYSPDFTGIFLGASLGIIQPIFTWGLIENARLAADHGVKATQAGVDVKNAEVALRVKQAYWGLVTAKQIRDFLVDVRAQVQQAVERTERLVDGGFATDLDVYRLRANEGELDKNLNLVDKTIDLARSALATWTGQPAGTIVEPSDGALPTQTEELRALELFIQDAESKRPEFTQLREGLTAKRNLVEVEKKRRYPLFFVGVIGTAAYATNRDRLDNPFVVDPLNHVGIGPVIGFRYNLDFGLAAGKIKEAEAEVHKLEALQDYARDGIPLQVREAYNSVVEARQNVRAFDEAHKNATKWLVSASSNADLGIGDTRDLADAFVAFAKTQGEYLQALYAYVFGLDRLANAAGLDVDEIRRLVPPDGRPGAGATGGIPGGENG